MNLLSRVMDWLSMNSLTLNIDRTVYMAFVSYFDSVPETLSGNIRNKLMKPIESNECRGVTFECNMKWVKHVQNLIIRTKYLIIHIFMKLT